MNRSLADAVQLPMRRCVALLLLAASCGSPGAPSTGAQPTGSAAASGGPSEASAPKQAPVATGRVGAPSIRGTLAWTLGGLPEGYADRVRALADVTVVGVVSSGTAWLSAWRGANGQADRPPDGLKVPVEIAATDPEPYASLLEPARVRRLVSGLPAGQALLGSSAAEVRGVGRGGRLRLGGRWVRIAGVVDDVIIGGHEMFVGEGLGASLGIAQPRYLVAGARPGVDPKALEPDLRALVPEGIPVRTRSPDEARFLRAADITLPPAILKLLFGEFAASPDGGYLSVERGWVRRNIRTERVPILGEVTCHRRIIPLVRGALSELVRRGMGDLVDPSQYGGCYSARFIGRDPGSGLSTHAWGVSIDINVADNPLGAEPVQDPRLVRTFERWGFVWGGRFIRPDGHHFQFACFPADCPE